MQADSRALVIACGALAHEVAELRRLNGWASFDVRCLPPELHNHPQRIAAAVREQIHKYRARYASIFVAYADCGTGGALDAVLQEEGIERIPGAHCYEFFAGARAFAALCEQEPGTFYLTDFLLAHFERLVICGLGIDRHPELSQVYFQNYKRLVYLAQSTKVGSVSAAREIAERLNLDFEFRFTGYGELEQGLARFAGAERSVEWRRC